MLTHTERDMMDYALGQFRFVRPGTRVIVEQPICDGAGRLVEVEYRWADNPERLAGKAKLNPDGQLQVETI
jgi:hypothetical protein